MSGHRGTNPGRHPWFGQEGRPQTEEEKQAMAEANVVKAKDYTPTERDIEMAADIVGHLKSAIDNAHWLSVHRRQTTFDHVENLLLAVRRVAMDGKGAMSRERWRAERGESV